MARSTQTIKQEIITQKNAETSLSGLTSNSQSALWNVWAFVTAQSINFLEQLWDALRLEVEEIASKAVPGTALWLKDRALSFQYGDVVQVNDDFSVGYPTINTENKIVTQCSVKQTSNRLVIVKVAKGVTPSLVALSATELSAFISYINKIKFAGTQTSVISLNADKLKVVAEIFYDGQYVSTTVKTNVIAAINAYLSALPFDGVISLNGLLDAIQAVQGVDDVVLNDVIARADTVAITSNQVTNLVLGSDWMARNYETSAGYIVGETTATHTLNDTITMTLSA
jgi:hypothetical protein